MTSSLREALDAETRGIPALGDIDAALEQVGRSERRRRTTVAAVSGLVAAAVVVWAAGLGTRSTDGAPLTPSPSGPPVVTIENQPLDLARAPLADGAEALVGTTAISGAEQRAAITGQFRIYAVAVSPDGRYLAWTGNGPGVGDQLHIRDLTTADEVFSQPLVSAAGAGGQTPRMEWSGDSRTLAAVVVETEALGGAATPKLEVQLVVKGADGSFAASGEPVPLPGPWVGVDTTGSMLYAESSGTLVRRSVVGRGDWGPWLGARAWPAGLDTAAEHTWRWGEQGEHRVSPDGRRVAWVQRHDGPGSAESLVGWITPETGEWTTWSIPGGDVSCAGWLGGELLVLVGKETTADVVAVAPDGASRVLMTYTSWRSRSALPSRVLVATDRLRG